MYLIAASLLRNGYDITITLPANDDARSYLQRCGVLQALNRIGIAIDGPVSPYNVGNARSLIEFMEIRTDLDGHENARLIDATRFRTFLGHHNVADNGASRIWMEVCSNAAEHSRAVNGSAFVVAQAYATELEIAVVDAGVGIPATLRHYDFRSDDEAIYEAVMRDDVTGRVDAAGRPVDGGLGLPDTRSAADRLYVRSGAGSVYNVTGQREEGGGLTLVRSQATHIGGTLVVATLLYPQC